jgi:hypothetical protein
VSRFHPGRAKDLSAPLYILSESTCMQYYERWAGHCVYIYRQTRNEEIYNIAAMTT